MDEFRDKDGKFKAGNLFSVGLTNNGVPPMYNDANKMAEKIAGYLNWEDAQKRPDSFSKMGKGVYTLSGLALFLGFASLQSLYDYEKRGSDFSYILNRFRLFMTHWNEQKMYWGGTYPAAQFWLRNHGGYTEETVQNQNQKVTNVTVEVIPSEHKINNSEKDIEI